MAAASAVCRLVYYGEEAGLCQSSYLVLGLCKIGPRVLMTHTAGDCAISTWTECSLG